MNTSYQAQTLVGSTVIFFLFILALWAMFDIGGLGNRPNAGWLQEVKQSLGSVSGLFLLGISSGILGGMLGMGGGMLKVSGLLLIFGYGMYLVRAVALVTNAFVYGSAFYRYRKAGLIAPELTKVLIPSAILGVLLGMFFGNYVGQTFLEKLIGLHALFVGTDMLWRILANKREKAEWDAPQGLDERKITGIGIPMGFSSGALGIGGGVISTPLQQMFLRVPLKHAIANTCYTAIFSCIFGGIIAIGYGVNKHHFSLWKPILISACIIPGAILGGQIGSILTKRFPVNVIRVIFTLLMFFSFYRIWF
ncbi:sulfite exporter TauE/SafE family protein [Candidatus Poribacteria bacterium]